MPRRAPTIATPVDRLERPRVAGDVQHRGRVRQLAQPLGVAGAQRQTAVSPADAIAARAAAGANPA